jgi:ribosomal protein S18 acetylase RimI-like enzyme
MDLTVRAASPEDEAAALLYESARPYYDVYAGGGERARALLEAVYPRTGHAASFEVCRIAEADGALAGVMAGFPARDGDRLSRRFVALTAPRLPPWHWPTLLRHLRAAAVVSPRPPLSAFYVDALAVAPGWRRHGVARRLLAEAEEIAETAGLRGVALDTGVANDSARALYEACGYHEREVRHAPDPAIASAVGGPGFVAYFKSSS